MGRVQNSLIRAVIAGQDHQLPIRKNRAEAQDIAEGGAAEAIDRLVVVPHHHEIAVSAREQLQELELDAVGVLKLVDQEIAEPPAERLYYRRCGREEAMDEQELIAEVDLP